MRKSAAVEVVWKGAPALRPFLVEVASLEPFPGNPRRGDVEELRASLRRWGQTRPILVDGSRIIAGHHLVEAATLEGFTHVAAIPNEFADEDEQLAYLVADNGTARRGGFDDGLLAEKLASLRDRFEGTGYTAQDRSELDARLAKLRADFEPSDDQPPQLDSRSGTSGLFEVPILLGTDDRQDFVRLVRIHQREWGIADVTGIVLRLLRESAARL